MLVEGEERVLAVLPPFHIYALSVNMLLGIRAAAELILHPRFDLEAVLKEICGQEGHELSRRADDVHGAAQPSRRRASYDLQLAQVLRLGRRAAAARGGAALRRSSTGCHLSEGWGMTETSPTGTFTPVHGMRKAGSCGMPLPQHRDPHARRSTTRAATLALGERGELCIRGPNVMKGYWNNPEATAEATTSDGMLRTGDVAIMDEDGFVFIVDRTKDMLLCSGFNVYPRNLEEAIYQHPAVAEVSVIGIHDEYRGQSPKAFVKLKPGAAPFTLAELQAFLKDRLGKHEMVQALEIRAELPKTPVGKLSKKELFDEEARKRAA